MENFKITPIDGEVEVRLFNSFDLNCSQSFKAHLDKRISTDHSSVIIDAGDCSYIDSSGIAALIYLKKFCDKLNINISFKRLSSNVYRVIELANLLRAFNITIHNFDNKNTLNSINESNFSLDIKSLFEQN
jgi:anti-anti-sigma factor